MRSTHFLTAAAASALLLLAACGDDDDTTSVDTPAGEIEIDPDGVDQDELQEAFGEDGEVDLDKAIGAVSIESKLTALEAGLDIDDHEVVDDKTLKIFVDGSAEGGFSMECTVAGAIFDDDETLIVVYPDGEITCE